MLPEYKCKACGRKVAPELFPDEDGNAGWWYHCQNPACGLFYGKPVYESDPEFPSKLIVGEPLERWIEQKWTWSTTGVRSHSNQPAINKNYVWFLKL
jgi:hypothetical protein